MMTYKNKLQQKHLAQNKIQTNAMLINVKQFETEG